MNNSISSLKWTIFLLALPACTRVAEGRATRDLEIGRAEIDGVSVTVKDGLANVRSLAPGELRLWAQAPSLSIEVKLGQGAGGPFRVIVENSLADAELTARRPGQPERPATLEQSPAPTERHFWIDLAPGTTETLSLRPPDDAGIGSFRFAVYADVQEKLDLVQDIYSKMNEDPMIRFALISGDLTAQGSDEQLARFQREMKALRFPCYATLGNHELGTRDDAFHDYFGRGNFSFTYRGVQFTLLDDASATIDPLVYDLLGGWLAEAKDRAHVVAMHIPPIDPVGTRNGSFANRGEADKFLSLLSEGKVDLTFYGHVHSYYAYENAGIPAYITGGGGAIPERLDGIGRHFLTVDVTAEGKVKDPALVRVD
jgi:Icc-related predicted phosphoesterase